MAREIYADYSDLVEPFGLDEVWCDVTGTQKLRERGMEALANEIRERVKFELGITVSVGASWNKIFAKLGSDYKKPDAVTVFTPENYRDYLTTLVEHYGDRRNCTVILPTAPTGTYREPDRDTETGRYRIASGMEAVPAGNRTCRRPRNG